MKILLTFFVLLFSSSLVSADEWNFEYLKEINDGCLKTAVENVSIGEAFEYCGCSTHHFYEDFTLNEIIEIYSSGKLSSNKKYNKIVRDCNKKIGY